jgi:hypothetical protein
MIVERERADAIQDLIKKIFRVNLLNDLPIDPVAHAEEPIAIDPVNGCRQRRRDTRDQAAVLSIEGMARAHKRDRAPGAATPPHRSNQHVPVDLRIRVKDIARHHAYVPVGLLWQLEEQIGFGTARAQCGHATVSRLKKLARIAEHLSQGLVRLADLIQMSGQAVDELECGELPLCRHHGASGWFSKGLEVKYLCTPTLRTIILFSMDSASECPDAAGRDASSRLEMSCL